MKLIDDIIEASEKATGCTGLICSLVCKTPEDNTYINLAAEHGGRMARALKFARDVMECSVQYSGRCGACTACIEVKAIDEILDGADDPAPRDGS